MLQSASMNTPTYKLFSHPLLSEGESITQLERISKFADVTRCVGLPDLHPGQGYPIGAVVMTKNTLYPAMVGNDIGCGMSLHALDLPVHKFTSKMAEKMRGLEEGCGCEENAWEGFSNSIGTVGGGNHFVEIQAIDELFLPEDAEKLGLNAKKTLLLVHTGSRGLGEKILRNHVDRYQHAGIDLNSDEGKDYWDKHDFALRFARANREALAKQAAKLLRAEQTPILDIFHNWVEKRKEGLVHRKGAAAAASKQYAVIPGSRGAYTYLVKSLANEDSLWSIPHGAGRKWKRTECAIRLSHRYRAEELKKTKLGNMVICEDKALLFEEAPQAYKNINTVIECAENYGLIQVVAKLRPLLTYKRA